MIAIQIRYKAHKEILKAYSSAGIQIIEKRDFRIESLEDQARLLAERYLKYMQWDNCMIVGFGFLPNSDYVATLALIQE